ncbi:PBP1A family penicillin-binding protein, partial [Oscillospiraceae bacterium OttesenSCG-928-F05]|nr:PBP1A family penicillin-binding protein [Oscillospiraceae bacterium OttesenSCG-928-F05]
MSGSANRPGAQGPRRNQGSAIVRRPRRRGGGSVIGMVFKVIGTLFLIGLTTGVILACIGAVYIDRYINTDLGVDPEDFQMDLTSFIYVMNKETGQYEVLQELFYDENRVWVSYDEIPQHMLDAVVAIEDKRFYKHNGVDWYRSAGAFVNMFLSMRDNFGGSTLTQQLIKNLTDQDDVTVRRKITEIFRALEFERNYEKADILEWYLNLVYFGQGAHGVQSAARIYFDKDVSDLTLAEAAAVVGITNQPTAYDPYLNPDRNKKRQEDILFSMHEQGYITEAEYDAAVDEPLVFRRGSTAKTGESAQKSSVQSYFVDQVIEDVIAAVMEERNIESKTMATRIVYTSGYHIYTTLDTDIQAAIDKVYTDPDFWPPFSNTGGYQPQSAIVVMDPYTGDVLGMAGGLGEKTGNRTFNRATQARRQPGSSIKPVAAYAPAIDAGLVTPYSVMTNMPVQVEGGRPWPSNSTYGGDYSGQMTIMKAVEVSINTVPAQLVKTLGPERCFDFAQTNMGLKGLVDEKMINGKLYSDIGIAPLSLGGLTQGVTVRDMTAAYASFANKGIYTESRTFTKVLDSNGQMVIDNTPYTAAVMKEKTAYYMNTLLQNVVTGPNGTAAAAQIAGGIATAGKTGTTDSNYDRWFVGYTPYYSAAVWVGYDENRKITYSSGYSPATKLWEEVMDQIHEGLESREFFSPEGLVKASYCLDSGGSPGLCAHDIRGSRVATGWFYPEDVPKSTCSVHAHVNMDSTTGQLSTPYSPVEQIVQVVMMNLDRRFETAGVVVRDEQYTIRHFQDPQALTGNGFRVVAPSNKDGTPLKNSFSTLYSDPNWQDSVSPSPDPEDPNASPDPGDVTDPEGPEIPPTADPGTPTNPPTEAP